MYAKNVTISYLSQYLIITAVQSPVMAGPWLARPSSSLALVEVHGQEHRDGEKDGEDGVEGIGDAERGKKLTHFNFVHKPENVQVSTGLFRRSEKSFS